MCGGGGGSLDGIESNPKKTSKSKSGTVQLFFLMNIFVFFFTSLDSTPDHSVYDSFSWVENYGDPGFRYFQASARLWGLMALRLASPDVLPFDPRRQATALEEYLAALTPPPPSDGKRGASVSLSEDDLAPLARAIAAFRTAADEIGRLTAASVLEGIPVEAVTEARAVMLRGAGGVTGRREGGRAGATGLTTDDLNERLAMTERRFLSPEGLPGRPWYRHVLQAPGLYLG